jgi:hypothetical protein
MKDWQPIFDGGCKNIVAILLGKEKSFVNLPGIHSCNYGGNTRLWTNNL